MGYWRRDTFEYGENILALKTYKEVKPHSSEESEDQVVDRERDNDENDEYVYYLIV